MTSNDCKKISTNKFEIEIRNNVQRPYQNSQLGKILSKLRPLTYLHNIFPYCPSEYCLPNSFIVFKFSIVVADIYNSGHCNSTIVINVTFEVSHGVAARLFFVGCQFLISIATRNPLIDISAVCAVCDYCNMMKCVIEEKMKDHYVETNLPKINKCWLV